MRKDPRPSGPDLAEMTHTWSAFRAYAAQARMLAMRLVARAYFVV